MSETTFFNIVKLKTNLEVDVAVLLDSPFTITAGLKPNLNTVTMSGAEFDKLKARMGDPERPRRLTAASLAFYYTSESDPDLTWGGMKIVDIEPGEIGDNEDGTDILVVTYKVTLADARWKFLAPRGGRLTQGKINDKASAGLADPVDNSQLMQMCLTAMGISATIPAEADAVEPMRDLNWEAAHAPTELEKLLKHTQMVFVPTPQGGFRIHPIGGTGATLAIPPERKVGTVDMPSVNLQPKVVVVTSSPTRVIHTQTLTGPGEHWRFVAPEGDPPVWKPLNELTTIDGLLQGPSNLIRKRFEDLDPTIIYRTGIWLYRALQLDPERWPPAKCRVLRKVITEDGVEPVQVLAKKASWNRGKWTTTGDWHPHALIEIVEGNILTFQEHLAKSDAPVGDLQGKFVPLDGNEVKIKFTVEEVDEDRNPLFYVAAFELGADGQIQQLSAKDAQAALEGAAKDEESGGSADIFVAHRPSMQLLMVDGDEKNRDELDEAAAAIAETILANSAKPAILQRAKGFLAGQLDGMVSEIRWDQQALHTTFVLQAWWKPSQAMLEYDPHWKGEPFPGAVLTSASRTELGNSSAAQPHVAVEAAYLPMPSPAVFPVKVEKVSGEDGNRTTPASWAYKVKDINGRVLAEEKALAIVRPPGKRIAGNSYGWACYGEEGDLVLLDAGERWVPC